MENVYNNNTSYKFELTSKQKKAGFTYLVLHSLFFLNIVVDALYIHFYKMAGTDFFCLSRL
ncbi:hypothetical protein [Macrococcus armenti]|uniref:hypothetical protein n=1 Tax=Macrococcus armenti TaxID=2875764 RepID=UPI001CCA6F98|nr:hypothetical protein [Macrococcus armenti]UBH08376.1 hypothetical protein LAU41_10385 [Macrococcus armenti]UBH10663.1 hypothetical protein LAU38_10585 [Macrococcus armenti]